MNGTAPHLTAPPPPPRRPPARTRWMGAVLAVVVGSAIGGLWAGLAPTPTADQPVSDVRLETTSFAGSNPFMAPVGEDKIGVVSPAGAEGTFTGDTPGLFGEQTDKPSCTGQALVDNLKVDEAKANAWSQALGIQPADIESYVGTLNPVVLRSDTAVTEHGYTDGRYTPYPAVLQAGTAVFVNSYGEPTVKCFSGNPLTRPADFTQASYTGRSWQAFAPTRITYVRPTTTVVKVYVYVDIDRGTRREHRSWCSDHSDSKYCERPNPDRWCDEHPHSKHCDGREDEHRDSDKHSGRDRDEHGRDQGDQGRQGVHGHQGGDGRTDGDRDRKDGDPKDRDPKKDGSHRDGDPPKDARKDDPKQGGPKVDEANKGGPGPGGQHGAQAGGSDGRQGQGGQHNGQDKGQQGGRKPGTNPPPVTTSAENGDSGQTHGAPSCPGSKCPAPKHKSGSAEGSQHNGGQGGGEKSGGEKSGGEKSGGEKKSPRGGGERSGGEKSGGGGGGEKGGGGGGGEKGGGGGGGEKGSGGGGGEKGSGGGGGDKEN